MAEYLLVFKQSSSLKEIPIFHMFNNNPHQEIIKTLLGNYTPVK